MKVLEVSKKNIQSIARAYTRRESPLNLTEIARRLNTTRDTISKVLHRGIAEGILDKPTCELIYHKNVHAMRGSRKAILAMDKAFEKRENLVIEKFSLRKKLNEKVKDLKYKISEYEYFFFEEEGAPSLQDLEEELTNTIEELAEVDEFLKFVL